MIDKVMNLTNEYENETVKLARAGTDLLR